MPELGGIRPWEMENFTFPEVEVLQTMARHREHEAKKMRSARG